MASAQESQYQYDLQLQRTQKLEDVAFGKIAAGLVSPKKGRYILAGTLAIVGDLLDLLDITGIGEVVTLVVDLVIDPILTWLGFKMNKELKNKEKASEGINGMTAGLHQKIEGYRNTYQSLRNARGKLQSFRKTGGKIKIKLKKPKAVKKRGILGKIFLGQIIDFIPLAELYPARTHSIWSAYKAEKAAYREGLAIIQDYQEARAIEIEERTEYSDSLAEEQAEYEDFEQQQLAA